MRKTVLPTLLLLGVQQATASLSKERSLNLAEQSSAEIEAHLNEMFYDIIHISDYTVNEITTFWENKENGQYCTDLFNTIITKYNDLVLAAEEIDNKIDEYNTNCHDKCLPGYVKCEGDYSNKCIKECDCCASHSLYCCSDSSNHPPSTYNYATGDGEVLYCYDWCCQEDETRCNGQCVPDEAGMPAGYGPATSADGPKVCCEGQDCCDAGETYI